ncbi:AhpD family alkylhydroperoxidase [Azospirillum lipoferum]|uniref:Carboxymuconolactone decarboxylase family protein n=1 Tax=Azospirillum lipoferum TaxID=193 RepID=A0A5A9GD02_AZOLI|nr:MULTISPECIES: carboxymuconolactone decarboxylase family protein [Azospirillum]KAA0592187.1 carboxymuconolactone decarboxylase family protein [Azospirillum lipoferum]MCP1612331.1 AhpD family alkylhydroperoxidase [Azospirillum lipoferum]MDW5536447.1 carboxymuconolactone decarboxylase family protein [Azospirillum sp. NL1]
MAFRFTVAADAPSLFATLYAASKAIRGSGLPTGLIHLIDLRVSQINGCTYCIDLHSKEARHDGQSEQRIAALAEWERSELFLPDERAAFAWAEALTRTQHDRIDDAYRELQRHFNAEQIAQLTVTAAQINAWNRIGIAQHIEGTAVGMAA